MEVKFDNSHLAAYGKKYDRFKSPYAYYHRNATLSQIQVCITGKPEYILEKLKKMVNEMEADLKRPAQGTTVGQNGDITEVLVPVWDGKLMDGYELPEMPAVDEAEIENELQAG